MSNADHQQKVMASTEATAAASTCSRGNKQHTDSQYQPFILCTQLGSKKEKPSCVVDYLELDLCLKNTG